MFDVIFFYHKQKINNTHKMHFFLSPFLITYRINYCLLFFISFNAIKSYTRVWFKLFNFLGRLSMFECGSLWSNIHYKFINNNYDNGRNNTHYVTKTFVQSAWLGHNLFVLNRYVTELLNILFFCGSVPRIIFFFYSIAKRMFIIFMLFCCLSEHQK